MADRWPHQALPGFREATARLAVAGEAPAGGMTAVAQAVVAVALAAILSTPAPQPDTFSNIPPTLSGAFHFGARHAGCHRSLADEGVPSCELGLGRGRRQAGADQAPQVGQGAAVHDQVRRHLHPRRRRRARRGPPQRQEVTNCSSTPKLQRADGS